MANNKELVSKLSDAISEMDEEEVVRLTQQALSTGLEPTEIIEKGLRPGISQVGDRYACGEAFVPELLLAAKAMNAAIEVLRPEMVQDQVIHLGKVVMGSVAGDLHDIGKDLVISMIEMTGFEVIDLGIDVPNDKFIESIEKHKPDVIGMSALMSTSIHEQEKFILALTKLGLRERVKVIVGGAAVTAEWAKKIGADGFSDNAADAASMVKSLLDV